MEISVVILAAGAGTRMRSSRPKVLHSLCGHEMLYHIIAEAQKISHDIQVVLYHGAEEIQQKMEQHFQNISYVRQDHENYPGTGGAVMNLIYDHDRVLVLNGDMPLVEAKSLQGFCESPADVCMSVLELENPAGYGRVIIEHDQVMGIVEEKDANEEEKKIRTVNGGVYSFSQSILKAYLPRLTNDNKQKEYYLTDVVGLAVKDGKQIQPVTVSEESFKGVNSKLDLAHAEEIMLTRIRNHWMRQGVIMRLPETIYIESDVEFKGECVVENGVSIVGKSSIEDSHIKAQSVIEESRLVKSSIGPMARIRPGSTLRETHIGNFVETKKAELNGVKAGHLSYLGDCSIDEGTNVGAGTITCNYDGKAKHKTVIGKNVFIGSDTQLVAPVRVEDEVLIAAGTTVTSDVPRGSLVISRTKQTNKPGFFRAFFGLREKTEEK